MSYSYRGIGIRYYGKRDFHADGSYVTTKWFCVLYLPLVPLKSLRIMLTGASKYYGLHRIPVVVQQEMEKLSRSQVVSTYAFAVMGVGFLLLSRVAPIRWLILPACLWSIMPFLLRLQARNRIKRMKERRAAGLGGAVIE